jgi:hypothetical protein
VQEELCELRFDVPLPPGGGSRQFEQGWRQVLAAQKLTALAVPPAEAVAARFRLCGTEEADATLGRYLAVRLAALPGSPAVSAEAALPSPDWRGVKVWLSYRAPDLAALLRSSRQKSIKNKPFRGRR